MIRVFLVDDHAILLEGLRRQFEDAGDMRIVGQAGTAKELLAKVKASQADVVVLDLSLPDGNGMMVIKDLKDMIPNIHIVVLTMYDHVRYAMSALETGADGFVVKGSAFDELLQAIRSASTGKTYVSADMSRKLIGRIRKGAGKSVVETLSEREFEVLTMLSQGMPIKAVAETMHISSKTVTTYRARLMSKLGLNSSSDLIRFSMENNLLK